MSETSWISLDASIGCYGLAARELAAVKAGIAAVDSDPDQVVAGIIADLVAEIRMNIASAGRSQLSSDTAMIPQALKPAACDILRYRLLSLYANTITESRTKSWEAANALLQAVRRGEMSIPSPDGGPEAPGTSPSPHYSGRPIRWGMRVKKGIM